jgi:hypothetical protein
MSEVNSTPENRPSLVAIFLAIALDLLVRAMMGGFLLNQLWSHIVVGVFPGLVASGAIAKQISFLSAFYVMLFYAMLTPAKPKA